jgi:hypothetical protein
MDNPRTCACQAPEFPACVALYHDANLVNRGGPHGAANAAGSIDGGLMDVREIFTGTDVPAGVRLKAARAVLQATGTLESVAIGETDPDEI